MKILSLIVIAILFTTGCDSVEPQEIIKRDPQILDPELMGVDIDNGIILYSGDEISISAGQLTVENTIFQLDTAITDIAEISAGEGYPIRTENYQYAFFYTNLPIISISTDGNRIVDDPKIPAAFTLLESDAIPLTGTIGIEIRGGSSQQFPEKSFSIEFWEDETGENSVKTPLLGMRNDDDWILDGVWNELIRIRDFTAHQIWLEMGRVQDPAEDMQLGIDREFCELILNGEYRGLYYLSEKIDRKQLDLKKYKSELRGELYKGNLTANGTNFGGLDDYDNNLLTWSGYEVKYPKEVGEFDWTNLHGLVDFVVNSDDTTFNAEVDQYLDVENMMDYFIFVNLIYATDNVSKNVYTAREKAGSPYYFVPWDMDGSFGNDWAGDRIADTDFLVWNNQFLRLRNYVPFQSGVKDRWFDLRAGVLETSNLQNIFRENYSDPK